MMYMSEKKSYIPPELEVLFLESEQLFALSNMEQIGDEKPETDW